MLFAEEQIGCWSFIEGGNGTVQDYIDNKEKEKEKDLIPVVVPPLAKNNKEAIIVLQDLKTSTVMYFKSIFPVKYTKDYKESIVIYNKLELIKSIYRVSKSLKSLPMGDSRGRFKIHGMTVWLDESDNIVKRGKKSWAHKSSGKKIHWKV